MVLSILDKKIAKPDLIGSYSKDDVIFLLKDISSLIDEKGNNERERAIQSGKHYSEMLPVEYKPSSKYLDLFYDSLNKYSMKLATAVGVVAELILEKKGENLVLLSLARAGTPVGILIKRYIKERYLITLPHYSISIIRDKGIDVNAIIYILKNHPSALIQFVDGWTGKGVITKELSRACNNFRMKYGIELDSNLGVIADPCCCSTLYGTREDFLIPSSFLNSTVSGLVSRTVLCDEFIGKKDFHGAKFYKELQDSDLSNYFLEMVSKEFRNVYKEVDIEVNKLLKEPLIAGWSGLEEARKIQKEFSITNINFIKPGIGETTRVLLRRVPWKILVAESFDKNLDHIFLLAKEKGVLVESYPLLTYSCCGIVKNMSDN